MPRDRSHGLQFSASAMEAKNRTADIESILTFQCELFVTMEAPQVVIEKKNGVLLDPCESNRLPTECFVLFPSSSGSIFIFHFMIASVTATKALYFRFGGAGRSKVENVTGKGKHSLIAKSLQISHFASNLTVIFVHFRKMLQQEHSNGMNRAQHRQDYR
jgi:hypothetical protein